MSVGMGLEICSMLLCSGTRVSFLCFASLRSSVAAQYASAQLYAPASMEEHVWREKRTCEHDVGAETGTGKEMLVEWIY